MTGLAKAPVLVLMVLLCVSATGAEAATRARVEPPTTTSSLYLRGTHRFEVEVSATAAVGQRSPEVTVEAVKERYKVEQVSVAYSIRGRWLGDGGFAAALPGLGRIAVRFEQSKVDRVPTIVGCNGPARLFRRGAFHGTIAFRGPRGFTVVHARRAPGQVRETFGQTCPEPEPPETGAAEPGAAETPAGPLDPYLFVAGSRVGAALTFSAAGPPASDGSAGGGVIPPVAFGATYRARRGGIQVSASASVDGPSRGFSVPGRPGALTGATVEPPAPFVGQGVYRSETPTTSVWSGDLSVALPGIGTVPLAGPAFTARLCEGIGLCTGPSAGS